MKTVIEMVREAGFEVTYEYRDGDLEWGGSTKAIERLVELVRADAIATEREACAKVCESEWSNVAERMYGEECANAIRARGQA